MAPTDSRVAGAVATSFTGRFLAECTSIPAPFIEPYAEALIAQGFDSAAMLLRIEVRVASLAHAH